MPITTVLFDLDNTLYPASSGMMQSVDRRITEYVQQLLHLSPEEAWELRHRYFTEYGTTLHGLQRNHNVDADHYLAYVHDLAFDALLSSDAELDHLLSLVRAEKVVFTNSPGDYAQRVLRILGIERHFSDMFDIRRMGLVPKPHPSTYQLVLRSLGVSGSEMVFVEDTPKNLVPARALGMTTILLAEHPEAVEPDVADYVVPDVLEAVRVVLQLEAQDGR
jgi:putative hydrolase of the HAD superfamily